MSTRASRSATRAARAAAPVATGPSILGALLDDTLVRVLTTLPAETLASFVCASQAAKAIGQRDECWAHHLKDICDGYGTEGSEEYLRDQEQSWRDDVLGGDNVLVDPRLVDPDAFSALPKHEAFAQMKCAMPCPHLPRAHACSALTLTLPS